MFVINDMELLVRLGKNRILEYLLSQCAIGVSAIRVTEYSLIVKREIERYKGVSIVTVDEKFNEWAHGKRKNLSFGDISSLYISLVIPGNTLVLSSEDSFLELACRQNNVPMKRFDDFVTGNLKDEKIIKLYNLIKVA